MRSERLSRIGIQFMLKPGATKERQMSPFNEPE